MRKFILILFSLSYPLSVTYALDETFYDLKKGKDALDRQEFVQVLIELSTFVDESNLLQDYALLWRAKAYRGLSDLERSLNDIHRLRSEHPESPIYKDALELEIQIISKINPEKTVLLCQNYLERYPDDNKIRFFYAGLLKETGKKSDSQEEFLKIYLHGGEYSKEAARYIHVNELSAQDLLERAKNLIKRYHYKEAEHDLKKALKKAPDDLRRSIFENRALALFKQKRYREAAMYYYKIGDIYKEAVSLYRADDKERFDEKLKTLIQMEDPRAAKLQLVNALYLRRKGEIEASLELFASIEKGHFLKEDARWHTGWTYYLTDRYHEAQTMFESLYKRYGDSKYLYWMAKASENNKKNVPLSYEGSDGNYDFYRVLAALGKNKKPPPVTKSDLSIREINANLKRLSILLELQMEEAVNTESLHIAKDRGEFNHDEVLQASILLNHAGLYFQSISLAVSLPYDDRLHGLLYPFAYKEIIHEASERFSINPLLILSVIREESRFNPDAYSPAGAIGLMQLIPATARRFGKKIGLKVRNSKNIFDVKNNIFIGTRYIRHLVDKLGSLPAALASYNAGEYNVKKWLAAGDYDSIDEFIEDIPYNETKNYVKRVLKTYFQYSRTIDSHDGLEFYAFH